MGTYKGTSGDNHFTAHKEGGVWKSWTMKGMQGCDVLKGGPKNDIIYGDDSKPLFKGDSDILYGGAGHDKLYGGEGMDSIYGEDGNDFLDGGAASDPVYADELYGGKGNDTLFASGGGNILHGYGGGNEWDTLMGEGGSDTFVLGDSSGAFYVGSGHATIINFEYGEGDKFQVYGSENDYSLGTGNWSGSGALDTGIYYQNHLIAVVQDKSGLDVLIPNDFTFV